MIDDDEDDYIMCKDCEIMIHEDQIDTCEDCEEFICDNCIEIHRCKE